MATLETLTVDQDYTPLDLLLWRRFRSEELGRVERTIELNRHICDHVYLPVGTVVTIEIPDPKPIKRPVVNLWT